MIWCLKSWNGPFRMEHSSVALCINSIIWRGLKVALHILCKKNNNIKTEIVLMQYIYGLMMLKMNIANEDKTNEQKKKRFKLWNLTSAPKQPKYSEWSANNRSPSQREIAITWTFSFTESNQKPPSPSCRVYNFCFLFSVRCISLGISFFFRLNFFFYLIFDSSLVVCDFFSTYFLHAALAHSLARSFGC